MAEVCPNSLLVKSILFLFSVYGQYFTPIGRSANVNFNFKLLFQIQTVLWQETEFDLKQSDFSVHPYYS